jgi:hypothetical protein
MHSPCPICVKKANCPALVSCKTNNARTAERREIVCDENREIDTEIILKALNEE